MKKRLFDPTISIGNILSFVGMIGAIFLAWNSMTNDISVMKYQISDLKSEVVSINNQLSNRTAAIFPNYRLITLRNKNGQETSN